MPGVFLAMLHFLYGTARRFLRMEVDFLYPYGYILHMNIIKRSEDFDEWLKKLRDTKGKIKILSRIDNARRDNFGDAKALGGGLSEMRIHYGPGYRLYYTREGEIVYFLLVGGDKSTQQQDIAKARKMMEE